MIRSLIALLVLAILLGLGLWFIGRKEVPVVAINSFEECAAAGYPIMESYPTQCRTPDGRTFTENVGNELEKIDLIRLTNPRPNQVVDSPLTVEGEARGTWYFEATFPVKLLDTRGNVLAETFAQAQGEWMTEEFVPFRTTLTFATPTTEIGTLVLEKDNPSGLPEEADALTIPIKFR